MKTKIAIIGTVGLPANYGGFETLTEHLVEELSDQFDFTVYCSSKRYKKEERKPLYKGAKLKYIPLNANGIQSIPYDTLSIIHALFFSKVLIILGVAGSWILPFVRLFTNRKIIISIDGIEWKREKWSLPAKLYLWWAEKIAVKFSHIDISDNEAIQDYTALRYGTLSRIIEYGADHATPDGTITPEDLYKYPFLTSPYAVKVCRIEPENNVHKILEVFHTVQHKTLVIIGNWQNSEYGRNLKAQYKDSPNICILDPVYQQREIDLIRSNAEMYIHGHSAGGTNPSLVEAMYLKLPVFAFDVSYNRVTTENTAFYFRDTETLTSLLLTTTSSELNTCSLALRKIAERKYIWKKIAGRYRNLIRESCEVNTKQGIFSQASALKEKVLSEYEAVHLKNNQIFQSKY